jgi:hypothetical protein
MAQRTTRHFILYLAGISLHQEFRLTRVVIEEGRSEAAMASSLTNGEEAEPHELMSDIVRRELQAGFHAYTNELKNVVETTLKHEFTLLNAGSTVSSTEVRFEKILNSRNVAHRNRV